MDIISNVRYTAASLLNPLVYLPDPVPVNKEKKAGKYSVDKKANHSIYVFFVYDKLSYCLSSLVL